MDEPVVNTQEMSLGIERRSRVNSQEVPARAVDDADVPARQTYFALCFGFHIE